LSSVRDGAEAELAAHGSSDARPGRGGLRLALRGSGFLLVLGGLLVLAWVLAVWRWQDPLTLLLNQRSQARLASAYEVRVARVQAKPAPAKPREPRTSVATYRRAAASYRRATRIGDPIGRLIVPRLGLRAVVVFGTDTASLKKGPGLHPTTGLPGQGHLAYVAGHRTTYGAPFSDIDKLERGDRITFEVPYGTFRYVVVGHRIVRANQLEVLNSRGREEIALQACWPRFFASHRYIAYGKFVRFEPAR
jgi:sortase A